MFKHKIFELVSLALWPILFITALPSSSSSVKPNLTKSSTYNDILKSLKYPQKLIVDVPDGIKSLLLDRDNSDSLDDTGFTATPVLHFGIEKDTKLHLINEEGSEMLISAYKLDPFYSFLKRNASFTTTMHYLIDTRQWINQTGALTKEILTSNILNGQEDYPKANGNIVTVLVKCEDMTTRDAEAIENAIFAFKSKRTTVKFGVYYHPYHHNECRPLYDIVDVIVLIFDLKPENFYLSYGNFERQIKQYLSDVQNLNPMGKKYIFPILSAESHYAKRYFYFLLKFSALWVNSGEKEGIILKGFTKWDGKQDWFVEDKANLMKLSNVHINFRSDAMKDVSVCWLSSLMDTISSRFSSVFLYEADILHYQRAIASKECKSLQNITKSPSRLWIGVTLYSSVNQEDVMGFTKNFNDMKEINLALDLWFPRYLRNRNDTGNFVSRFVKKLLPNVKTSCEISVSEINFSELTFSSKRDKSEFFVEKISKKCNFIWNVSSTDNSLTIWRVTGLREEKRTFNAILEDLNDLREKVELFRKTYHGRTSILFLERDDTLPNLDNSVTLYCSPKKIAFNEKMEMIINYGRIYNIPIMAKDALTDESEIGWWSPLKSSDKLQNKTNTFPVFMARNYPSYHSIEDFPTDPCIPKKDKLSEKEIEFNKKYSGVTLYIDSLENGFMAPKMVELMLRLTFEKFDLIEIVSKTFTDLNLVIKVLSDSQFRKTLNVTSERKVYLNFNGEFIKEMGSTGVNLGFFDKLFKTRINLTGIHFTNWGKNVFLPKYEILWKTLLDTDMEVGLVLTDCIQEVNNDFKILNSTEKFISQVNYLLCDMKERVENKESQMMEMEKFLDTHLYIQKYYQQMFPNDTKEILFRLNLPRNTFERSRSSYRRAVKEFLEVSADVNQYAGSYQIRFFQFPAFDSQKDGHYGWWKDTNDEISVYKEKEAEYFGKRVWHSGMIEARQDMPPKIKAVVGVIISFIILICGGITGFTIYKYKKKTQFLTEDEVKDFKYGSGNNYEGVIDAESINNMKFPKEYEIPKENFTIGEMLGKGNFGQVFKADVIIKNEDGTDSTHSAAVKMPLPCCPKEIFKSMLSELKILSYIGSHPHVVEFLGAHTKDIRKGSVLIATGICEHGALQDYLRNLNTAVTSVRKCSVSEKQCVLLINLHELYRFAREIALGMEYISNKKIIHGDLSTRNVMLDSNLSCRIGDFGLSRKLYDFSEYVKQSHEPLPWRWMAIESLRSMHFTTQSDVWSYGITLWEIFSLGGAPYPGHNYCYEFMDEIENGYRLGAPTYSNVEIYKVMMDCWLLEPENRPTFSSLAQFFATLGDCSYTRLSEDQNQTCASDAETQQTADL